jgi:hypothetical protein
MPRSLAYFDDFWLIAVLGVSFVLLVPLMKRSVAEKGSPSRRRVSIAEVGGTLVTPSECKKS